MEDKIKILETKLKLTTDILYKQKQLLWNLQGIAEQCQSIMIHAKDGESTDDNPIFKFTKEQVQTLEDLIYTAKSDDLTSQNTPEYLKTIAREKEIKQEILNGL
jgi:hypothetical protein